MLQILLLDDDEVFLRKLRGRIREEMNHRGQEVIIDCFQTIPEVLNWLACSETLDLAFLDIDMGQEQTTGIDVAAAIREKYSGCGIVYLTAYLEFVTSVFETKPLYFITKNELDARLQKALDMFFREYSIGSRYILVQFGKTSKMISVSDIIYCEHNRRRTRIVTTHGEALTTKTISAIKEELPPERFASCHNSYLINLGQISSYDRMTVEMSNGDAIPISRAGRTELMEKLAVFFRDRFKE